MGRDGKPMCMHMYRHHFNACRIPKPQRDDYATFDPSQHTHVAVMRKNHFYSLNLWAQDRNGSPRRLSTPEIARCAPATRMRLRWRL